MNTILQINNLRKKFKNKLIVDIDELHVQEQEIVGLVGPNGCGKTTTMKLCARLLIPNSGMIHINGYNINKDYEKAMGNSGFMFDHSGFYNQLTGYKNLMMKYRFSKKEDVLYLDKLIEELSINKYINNKVNTYSLGTLQKLSLARALLNKPKILFLDEPLNGLDASYISFLKQYIKKLNITVFISSHLLYEIDSLCNRVLFFQNGRIIENYLVPNHKGLMIEVNDIIKTQNILNSLKIENYIIYNKFIFNDQQGISNIFKILLNADIEIISIKDTNILETKYLGLFGGMPNE